MPPARASTHDPGVQEVLTRIQHILYRGRGEGSDRNILRKGAHMYTLEFYEDKNGRSILSDFLHLLHAAHREEYYKMAAFLDYLAENGSGGDRAVCRVPGGEIYLHCFPGFENAAGGQSEKRSAKSSFCRAGPVFRKQRKGFCGLFPGRSLSVCVLLYGRSAGREGEENTYVLLHHYFTDRVPGGIPLLHIYLAVRELQAHRHLR